MDTLNDTIPNKFVSLPGGCSLVRINIVFKPLHHRLIKSIKVHRMALLTFFLLRLAEVTMCWMKLVKQYYRLEKAKEAPSVL